MKISNYGQRPTGVNPYQRELASTKIERKTERERKTDDKLEMSQEALRLQQQNIDPARLEKVRELKTRYENGTYTIDYVEVARKMLQAFDKEKQ